MTYYKNDTQKKARLLNPSEMNDVLKTLSGETLSLICVNRTQLFFHFGSKSFIQVEELYNLYDGSIAAPEPLTIPQLPLDLLGPIEQEIVKCAIDAAKTLHVHFANGWKLEVYAYDTGLPPYQFMVNGEEIFLS